MENHYDLYAIEGKRADFIDRVAGAPSSLPRIGDVIASIPFDLNKELQGKESYSDPVFHQVESVVHVNVRIGGATERKALGKGRSSDANPTALDDVAPTIILVRPYRPNVGLETILCRYRERDDPEA